MNSGKSKGTGKNGGDEREKTQKILVADLEDKPISLWLRKVQFPVLEVIKEAKYFLLKAIVKSVPQNPEAKFLVFQAVARGKDAYQDVTVRRFCEARIRQHAQAFREDLDLWKKYGLGGNEDLYVLNLALSGFVKDFAEPTPPAAEDTASTSNTARVEVIKMVCYECQYEVVVEVRTTADLPTACPQCGVVWSAFTNNFHYEVLQKRGAPHG